YLITMFLIPYKVTYILFGFVLFRIFDIIKPLPINKIESLPGAHGVMLDDAAAGIYACLVLHGYIFFLK
ncbi:phosphatidylglycerophosphatase A, partial [Candidatus Desantisbacteria bacterium]|nr:phosphatidylglycerophosphatase A [Candidatus Desantisbacteria bacterium]